MHVLATSKLEDDMFVQITFFRVKNAILEQNYKRKACLC
jgi:hypothetical protein